MVVEGHDFTGTSTNIEFQRQHHHRQNLGIPAVIIVKGEGKAVQEIVDTSVSNTKSFRDEGSGAHGGGQPSGKG